MPRRASDSVVTHRIEAGVWEREQVKPIITAATVASYGIAASAVAAAGGIALAGVGVYYALRKSYAFAGEVFDDVKEVIDDAKEAVAGVVALPGDVASASNPLGADPDREYPGGQFTNPREGKPIWENIGDNQGDIVGVLKAIFGLD